MILNDVNRRPRSCFVKCEKRHRYVSRCGPLVKSSELATAQAISAAENEGWPVATAHRRHKPLASNHPPLASLPSAELRR